MSNKLIKKKNRFSLLKISLILSLFFSTLLPHSASAEPAANLIAHWKFSEGSLNNILDSSGNAYHGISFNTSWTNAPDVTALDPYAMSFNGSSSYVDTASFDINDDFAISAWIKPDSKNTNGSIIAKHTSDGENLLILGLYNGKYHFRIRDKSFYGPYYHTGDWIHVAVSGFKEAAGPTIIEHVSLYINGTFIERHSMVTEIGDMGAGKAWTIGQDWDGDSRTDFFDGFIDDIRIYDGELSPSEIKDLSQDFSAVCHLQPGENPNLNFAAGSGVCDQVLLEAGSYSAANIQSQNNFSIIGAGHNETIISITGSGNKQFINNSFYDVMLQDVTIQNGYAQLSGDVPGGGAIQNQATMTLNNVHLNNNQTNGDGGAIYNSGSMSIHQGKIISNSADNGGAILNSAGGTIELFNVEFAENNSNGGGGILNMGSLFIKDTLITNNSSNNSGGGILNYGILHVSNSEIFSNNAIGKGGGIYNDDFSSFAGIAAISHSEINYNLARASGGGISNAGTMTVDSSTISNNEAGSSGGGISSDQLANQIDIINSTISNNVSDGIGSGFENGSVARIKNSTISGNLRKILDNGSGIYSNGNLTLQHITISNNSNNAAGKINGLYAFGTLSITNSLIVDNGSANLNCGFSSAEVTQSGNLSDDDSCSEFTVADAAVLPLADNGGPSWTHALPEGSPAFESADPAYCLVYDQRSIPRGRVCDIGAFELGEASLIFLPAILK